MNNEMQSGADQAKKKKSFARYLIYITLVLVATAVSLMISLWGDNFNQVINAFKNAEWGWFALTIGLAFGTYFFEALILLVFCRLYTRQYKFHQGLATSLIGQFYCNVTPGASGGQPMQIYTLKSQGIQVSNAASIMVMSFILYQSSLIIFDVVALIVEWEHVLSITVDIPQWGWHLPMWPIIIVGFLLNLSVIFLLLLMSYSHKFHNFILHHVIGFLGKIRIIKDPDGVRESLRVQVENFKIELKRLASNIPVLTIQVLFYFVILFMRDSIPYFSALAVHATGPMFDNGVDFVNVVHVAFRTSFHQMVTGLIPLPGSAGVSELFYSYLFASDFQGVGVLNSSQILWRTATFHIVLLVSGIVAAFYHSSPKETFQYANRKTFVTIQLETYEERKRSADTLFETRQLSRKEIQRRMSEIQSLPSEDADEPMSLPRPFHKPVKPAKPPKPTKKPKKKKPSKSKNSWEEWNI